MKRVGMVCVGVLGVSALAVASKVAESLGDEDDIDQALAIHAICTGGLTMARSVANEEVALRIMRACRQFVIKRLPKGPASDTH